MATDWASAELLVEQGSASGLGWRRPLSTRPPEVRPPAWIRESNRSFQTPHFETARSRTTFVTAAPAAT